MNARNKKTIRIGAMAFIVLFLMVAGMSIPVAAAKPTSQTAAAEPAQVIITEILYNPVDEATGEFVEIQNVGNAPINLKGWTISDAKGKSGDVLSTSDLWLQPNQRAVITDHTSTVQAYGYTLLIRLTDEAIGSGLNNDHDKVTIKDALGNVVDQVEYYNGLKTKDIHGWSYCPDGYSIQRGSWVVAPPTPGYGLGETQPGGAQIIRWGTTFGVGVGVEVKTDEPYHDLDIWYETSAGQQYAILLSGLDILSLTNWDGVGYWPDDWYHELADVVVQYGTVTTATAHFRGEIMVSGPEGGQYVRWFRLTTVITMDGNLSPTSVHNEWVYGDYDWEDGIVEQTLGSGASDEWGLA